MTRSLKQLVPSSLLAAPPGAVQVASHGDQLPTLKPSADASCKPVRASRVKWPYSPSFDPRPFLHEPLTRAAFEDPALVHATRQELLLLARTWDEAGCLAIFPAAAVRRDEAVGLFTVAKDRDYDRLIVNPAVLNSRMATISRQTRTLAPGSMFSLIALAPDEALRLSSDDLREYYHTFIVSRARAKRNCIGLAFSDSELSGFRAFDSSEHAGRPLYLALRTLAMGDSLAIKLTQESHLRLGLCALRSECAIDSRSHGAASLSFWPSTTTSVR